MNDLISRQAAIDAIRKEYAGIHNANIDGDFLADEIEFIITKLSSVQERKGRWVYLYDSNYKCSECGAWWRSDDMDINEEFQFCPTCGAKMEGAEK